ncbi:hypothetical protein CDD83_5198 [Cordyceps sp. RAO-2017]|nr:hypothetical protein CDD83_5198 [Cordyceps sp. RAO-2017]
MAELKPNVSATTAPAAADESVLSVVVEALLVVAHALWRVRWASALSSLARLLAWPLALVLRPLSYAASVVLFLFGPAIHVLSFFLACAAAVVAFVASLEVRRSRLARITAADLTDFSFLL